MISFCFFSTKGNKLAVRFVNNRRKAELNLGVVANTQDLEEGLYALNHPKLKSKLKPSLAFFNSRISDALKRKSWDWPKDIDVKFVRDYIGRELGLIEEDPEDAALFTRHFERFINGKTNKGTIGVYKHTLDRIRLFDNNADEKKFEDIDLKWLTAFESFCAKTANKNARNIHLRNIRAVFNHALDYEITTAYPFRRFKIRPEATRKRSLSVEELRDIFNYPVEPYAELYRDMFALSFMLIGINSVDLWGLKAITRGRIDYKRAKTGRLYSIKVEPEAQRIINKHKGKNNLLCLADRWSDHRNFSHQCNKALHLIGANKNKGGRCQGGAPKKTDKAIKPIGLWPELTMYWARHSWATIAYSIGVSKDIIAQALGHSDGHDTTNIYIKEDSAQVDMANRRVLDWVLYGKR